MKRTFERLAFFIFGGIFVSIGYLLSGSDTTAAPRSGIVLFDTIACKKLIIHDGDPSEENIILGFGNEGEPQLYLSNPDEKGRKGVIRLRVHKDGPSLDMSHRLRGGTITLSTTERNATIQTSTRHRKNFNGAQFLGGAVIGSTAESSLIVLEGKTIETQPRLQ